MSKTAQQTEQQPNRRGMGRRVFIPLALVTAVGGFVMGMMGGPFAALQGTSEAEVVQVHAGTFPLAMPGVDIQFVDASVSIRPEVAPDGAMPLHDAVYVLLTEASGLPLVLDRRTSLTDLEKVVMSMAPVTAPWLVALDLEPVDRLSTAALLPDDAQLAEAGS